VDLNEHARYKLVEASEWEAGDVFFVYTSGTHPVALHMVVPNTSDDTQQFDLKTVGEITCNLISESDSVDDSQCSDGK